MTNGLTADRSGPGATSDGTSYRVACAQIAPVLGDRAGNIARTGRAIRAAAAAGARLVVLPEAVSSGYVFEDVDEAARYAEPVPGGECVSAWARLAAELDIWVAGGVIERAGGPEPGPTPEPYADSGPERARAGARTDPPIRAGARTDPPIRAGARTDWRTPTGARPESRTGARLYNSAVLVGPEGLALTYRKVHLWNKEKALYAPGDLGFPVADTPIGRIGLIICYDAWFPESLRSCALAGADLVCAVSDWVPVPGQQPGPPMANLMCMTGAHSNQLYVAAASRTGTERGQRFIGSSVIVDHTGWILAGPADGEEEQLLYAEVDPVGTREIRRNNPFNRPLHDRRSEAYPLLSAPATGHPTEHPSNTSIKQ